eukprot:TRINITY_DN1136_c0_g1_i1.p1 TRINITY_DN1136_c0_g1~~TRINITY_DN1136_c0_g1_i1.p1  ORF type:complete len:106 (-),score=19.53 TRINITY_DN1136_c0_g1_i1:72-389(-)
MSKTLIAGTVDENGGVISKVGDFTVSRDHSVGIYTVTFKRNFLTPPVVTGSQIYSNHNNPAGGDARDNVVLVHINNHSFKIKTGDSAGQGSWRSFTFLALGYVSH